ncbi:laccase-3-like [Coffea arabica]|uniref:Laccase n=1 Tax=Coffea arabica TaxID=13443 RepID=A0A6P6W2W4_COFAR
MIPQSTTAILSLSVTFIFAAWLADSETHYHEFVVQSTPIKRLCTSRSILTVNGQFPGPTIEVRDGDSLVIKVINRALYNVTIHWHGIRQRGTQWADGPEYVTQCPIQPGAAYTYRFSIQNQDGTLWWHAHSRWIRATIYGALVIYPKLGVPYPFQNHPDKDFPVILGEWWDTDILGIMRQALFSGAAPNVSDAYTINGQPGDFYRCSSLDTATFYVDAGDTVLLRIINAALNQQLFFTVANHMLTVVGADAAYNKPFTTRVIMVGPGQTTNVLLTADQPPARYYMATRAYATAQGAPFDNTTATAILEYNSIPCHSRKGSSYTPILPRLPPYNDTATVASFTSQFRSLSSSDAQIPTDIDENLFITVGLGFYNCIPSPTCQGPNATRFASSMNNVSFVLPRRASLLQAYYQSIPGVYTTDFPPVPPIQFDYTGNVPRALWQPVRGTKLYKLKYGSKVQVVFQDTGIFSTEDHPIHLHGHQFYVVGQGFGNFNPSRDSTNFNLNDPPERNTIGVPVGGWAAIRFVADNPGVWLMHCHIDAHLTWGLAMAFLVDNGPGLLQSVDRPPLDLPQC